MTRIRILDPTAPPQGSTTHPGPAAGPLGGKRVGIRHDPTWRSFEWVMDEWAESFEAAGASVRKWSVGARTGAEGEETAAQLAAFTADVDIVVAGLGN